MNIVQLTDSNVDMLAEMERKARVSEPDVFFGKFDEVGFASKTLSALNDPAYASAACLMCVDDEHGAIGRLDYVLLPSYAFGGDVRVYVDWIYVLKEHRHRGIARVLFDAMEDQMRAKGIGEYFLTMAKNEEAQRFYRSFAGAKIENHDMLAKEV